MKKILNWIVTVAGLLLLIGLFIISLNNHLGFMDTTNFQGLVDYLQKYGALTIVAALVFINLIGRSIIKIVLMIVFLALSAFYIWSSVFPIQFAQIFGI